MGARRRRARQPSASRITRRKSWEISCSWNFPKTGAKVTKGQTFGSVESVKAVSDIYSPVSGEVSAINDLLSKSPEKLNEDPHGAAWLIKVKLSSSDEISALMSAADYQKYIGAE